MSDWAMHGAMEACHSLKDECPHCHEMYECGVCERTLVTVAAALDAAEARGYARAKADALDELDLLVCYYSEEEPHEELREGAQVARIAVRNRLTPKPKEPT